MTDKEHTDALAEFRDTYETDSDDWFAVESARMFIANRVALLAATEPPPPVQSKTCPTCGSLDPQFRRVGQCIGDETGCVDAWHATPPAPVDTPPRVTKCTAFAHDFKNLPEPPR